MTITKMSIPRRTFLRGVGVTLALPFLDAMVPALTPVRLTAAGATKRFTAVYMPLGVINEWSGADNKWTPLTTEPGFDYRPIMKPLERLREHVTIVTNLSGGGGHTGPSTWLNGITKVKQTEAEDVLAATTLDQMVAKQIGQEVSFPSLELATEDFTGYVGPCLPGHACAYLNTCSWASATTPLPRDLNPRVVFERLFGRPGTVEQRFARMKHDRSILDSLTEEAQALQSRLGTRDRQRLGEYLDNVREIERRIQRTEAQNGAKAVAIDAPIGIPDSPEEHIGMMFDLMHVAYQADLTRVISFMMGREISMRIFPDLGVMEPHHAMSHHANNPEKMAGLAVVQTWFTAQFANHVEKLKNTPDGDGSLLDHNLIFFGSTMSNSQGHDGNWLPSLVVGGKGLGVRGDRHVREAEKTPLANLLVSIGRSFDLPMDNFGVSTGAVSL